MPNTAEPQSNTNSESNETEQTDHQVENPSLTDGNRTRSGRVSKPPERLMRAKLSRNTELREI